DVALGPEILPQDGAEQGQPADVIAPAELGELVLRYGGLHRTSELEQRVEGRAGVARRGLVAVLGELLGQLGGEEEALVAVPLLGDARRDLLVLAALPADRGVEVDAVGAGMKVGAAARAGGVEGQ